MTKILFAMAVAAVLVAAGCKRMEQTRQADAVGGPTAAEASGADAAAPTAEASPTEEEVSPTEEEVSPTEEEASSASEPASGTAHA